MVRIFILFIVFIILAFLLDRVISKLLGIDKKGKLSETSGKNIDRWGRVIIFIIVICIFPFVISKDTNVIKWFWILYLSLLVGFQAILEWKYLKNTKQYISSLIFLILGVIVIYNIEYFL